MNCLQPSLWDNVALENGYYKLNELQLVQAIKEFNQALKMDMGQQEMIRHAIATAEFWLDRIGDRDTWSEGHTGGTVLYGQWLEDFANYGFKDRMQAFRKRLLSHISDRLMETGELNREEAERAFDLMLGCGLYDKAKALLSALQLQYPEAPELGYWEAQVLWRTGDKPEANHLSAMALLLNPGSLAISRIENPSLREVIDRYGTEKAPAYGWIGGLLPLVRIPEDLVIFHEKHEQAVLAYDALQSAHTFLKNGDKTSCVRYRKELKRLDPDLYDAYFRLISRSV